MCNFPVYAIKWRFTFPHPKTNQIHIFKQGGWLFKVLTEENFCVVESGCTTSAPSWSLSEGVLSPGVVVLFSSTLFCKIEGYGKLIESMCFDVSFERFQTTTIVDKRHQFSTNFLCILNVLFVIKYLFLLDFVYIFCWDDRMVCVLVSVVQPISSMTLRMFKNAISIRQRSGVSETYSMTQIDEGRF